MRRLPLFPAVLSIAESNGQTKCKDGSWPGRQSWFLQIIEDLGLGDKLDKYPSELSGGEQQRVSIARALAKKPEILFLDEPTGALDEETGRKILDYIWKLKEKLGFTLIMVTHNQKYCGYGQNYYPCQ